MDRIEVVPHKNGKWHVSGIAKSFDTRREAIVAAYEQAGRKQLFDAEGKPVQWAEVEVPVDLLRPDGSTYGNLATPPSGGLAQRVSLEAARENGEGGELSG